MEQLKEELQKLIGNSKGDRATFSKIMNDDVVFPFSKESEIISYLISLGEVSYDQYIELNKEYKDRNKYLDLFDMSPRTYGQTWGESHIRSICPEFIKATKDNLASVYPDFDGEFDLWLDGIRVEVKACRANRNKNNSDDNSLACRAYLHSEAKKNQFKYHYQQLKPSCCDVFIWIGTCRDELLYWVLSSDELLKTGKLGSQHRNEHTGDENSDVFEGQVFMTEEELEPYLVSAEGIVEAVRNKHNA